jgi:preprotein translocase subunit Sec61beta
MADNRIQMPGAFGGLMRYDEEYKSRFMISPTQVILGIVLLIIFVLILKMLITIQPQSFSSNLPVPANQLFLNLID